MTDDRRARLASASAGALLTSLTMTPLDMIRVRMQSQTAAAAGADFMVRPLCPEAGSLVTPCRTGPWTYRITSAACPDPDGLCCARCHQPSYTRVADQTTVRAVYRLIRAEGLGALWRGLTPTLVQSIPSTVIYFNAYDELRQASLAPAAAGALARVGAATVVSPVELVRTRIMAHAGRPESAWALLQAVSREVGDQCLADGVRVLFRGLGPTLFRDVPFSALYWTGFEASRDRLRRALADTTPGSVISSFLAGTVSGSIAAVCTQPFDVIKTRQQIEQSVGGSGQSARLVAARIVGNGGWRGLFTGLTPRIAKIAPACAIMISSYEFGKAVFSRPIVKIPPSSA